MGGCKNMLVDREESMHMHMLFQCSGVPLTMAITCSLVHHQRSGRSGGDGSLAVAMAELQTLIVFFIIFLNFVSVNLH